LERILPQKKTAGQGAGKEPVRGWSNSKVKASPAIMGKGKTWFAKKFHRGKRCKREKSLSKGGRIKNGAAAFVGKSALGGVPFKNRSHKFNKT